MARGPRKATREDWARNAQRAWRQLKDGKTDSWPLWAEMAPILRVCRDDAMRVAGLDPRRDATPKNNGKYNTAMTQALLAVKLADLNRSDRQACIEAFPHLRQIADYREQLQTSPSESDRHTYYHRQGPQSVWSDYSKWARLKEERPKPQRQFADLKVREALVKRNNDIVRELSLLLGEDRAYTLAAGMLEQFTVPMKPFPADSLDVPSNARHDAIVALLDKLGWDTSERSRLADALGFAALDARAQPAATPSADLEAENERLKAELADAYRHNANQYKQLGERRQEYEALRAENSALKYAKEDAEAAAKKAQGELAYMSGNGSESESGPSGT